MSDPKVSDEMVSPGQQHLRDALRAPGEVAIEIAQPVTDVVEDGASWVSDAWTSIKETFSGVNYDEAANDAYGRRDEIIHDFAVQHRAKDISPEVMQDMQFLKDSGALDRGGEEEITARIAGSFLEMVEKDPGYYDLKAEETVKYDDDKQDITVYADMSM
ncbi:MAG: hypothetical protein COB36_02725 [Alphaproteobacteria bacterium]|nr:MAG: hypothetical protein COB36_02725 [Alphaproteobacteria bacterium]